MVWAKKVPFFSATELFGLHYLFSFVPIFQTHSSSVAFLQKHMGDKLDSEYQISAIFYIMVIMCQF